MFFLIFTHQANLLSTKIIIKTFHAHGKKALSSHGRMHKSRTQQNVLSFFLLSEFISHQNSKILFFDSAFLFLFISNTVKEIIVQTAVIVGSVFSITEENQVLKGLLLPRFQFQLKQYFHSFFLTGQFYPDAKYPLHIPLSFCPKRTFRHGTCSKWPL